MAGSSKQAEAVMLILLAATFVGTTTAASFVVGDNTGWTIPPSSSFYSTWASKQTFQIADVLVFNFQTGAHTVAEVSKSAYDSCSTTNPLSAVKTAAPANYTLSSGTHYYICTFSGHCSAGQKLAITATGPSSSAPSPQPSKKSPTPSAAPSPSKKTPSPGPSPTTTPPSPSPQPSKKSPTPSVAPSPSKKTPSPGPSPSTTTPTSPVAPSPSGTTTGVPPPAADVPTASPPSSDKSGASIAAGVSLLSLMSMAAVVLLF